MLRYFFCLNDALSTFRAVRLHLSVIFDPNGENLARTMIIKQNETKGMMNKTRLKWSNCSKNLSLAYFELNKENLARMIRRQA
jgi:hypothetical protein